MLPEHERLHPGEALVGDSHHRLVEDADSAALDCVLQVGLDDGALVGEPRISGSNNSIRRGALGAVHRAFAFAKQVFAVFLRAVIHRDADAARQDQIASANLHGRAQGPADTLSEHCDVARFGVFRDKDRH